MVDRDFAFVSGIKCNKSWYSGWGNKSRFGQRTEIY